MAAFGIIVARSKCPSVFIVRMVSCPRQESAECPVVQIQRRRMRPVPPQRHAHSVLRSDAKNRVVVRGWRSLVPSRDICVITRCYFTAEAEWLILLFYLPLLEVTGCRGRQSLPISPGHRCTTTSGGVSKSSIRV